MRERTKRTIVAGILFSAMALLCTGCIGYSEITYAQGKMNIVSQYYEGSAELINAKYTGDYQKSKENDNLYQTTAAYQTGKLEELVITQDFLEVDSLTYDGKDYLVASAGKIMNSDGQTVGSLTEGQTVNVLYFVEGLAIIPMDDSYGYVSRESLLNEDGTPLAIQEDQVRPYIAAQNGVGHMLLGNQHGIKLTGEVIPKITVQDNVVAVVVLSVDFDTLTVEGNTKVQLENCKGGTVICAPEAEISLGENAEVSVMTALPKAKED